jgi:VanZ family protein
MQEYDAHLHFAAFAVITLLAVTAFPRIPLSHMFVGLALLGGAIELLQFVPGVGRQPDWADFGFNILGIDSVLIIMGVVRRVWRPLPGGASAEGAYRTDGALRSPIVEESLRRLPQLLFWSALVFAFVMATLPQPPALPGDPSDKALHVLAFLVLAGLAAIAYPRARLVLLFLGLTICGGMIELAQTIPELGREASVADWLADLAAAAAMLLVVRVVRIWRRGGQ